MSVKQALFAELLRANPRLPGELAKVSVAADLTILVAQSGISRSELAKKLGWSRARVSQVLSGTGNLTIETIHAVAQAAGFAFDVAFRKPESARARHAWEQAELIKVPATTTLEFPGGRKAKAADFQNGQMLLPTLKFSELARAPASNESAAPGKSTPAKRPTKSRAAKAR